MIIRRAEERDIEHLMVLLSQVLEIHAELRPDIFVAGTTKYTAEMLSEKIKKDDEPIYVAEGDEGDFMGYAFCILRHQLPSPNMIPFSMMYIDDLCVDERYRGCGVGEALFDHVKEEARARGCYEVTLNVWEGNDSARKFYERLGMTTKSRIMEFVL